MVLLNHCIQSQFKMSLFCRKPSKEVKERENKNREDERKSEREEESNGDEEKKESKEKGRVFDSLRILVEFTSIPPARPPLLTVTATSGCATSRLIVLN